jgi:exodeoxyribonuclease V alpha subunit
LGAIVSPTEHDKALIDAHLEPQTLHRLLGYSQREGRYRHHVNHRLEPKVVILDEGSMIDLNLMGRLVQALADDARLVLLGDADQLPSVDAGAVLRDLVDADERARGAQVQQLALQGVSSPDEVARSAAEMRVVRLTHSYRMSPKDPMGRAILTAARLVNAGDPKQLFDHAIDGRIVVEAREHASELKFQGVEWVPPGAKEKAALLEKWIAEKITGLPEFRALATRVYRRGPDGFKPDDADALDRLTKHLASARILCATRVFSGGADTLNRLMHGRMLLHMDRTTDPGFIAGEPVLVERNDYDRKLFNGDQGVVVMAADGDAPAELTVVFRRDQRFDAFRLAGMQQDLSLAYAMTVHKAQGSEFDDVVFVLPDQNMPILTRELLYTAMTRSRRSVTLVGSRDLVEISVAAKMARFSGLADGIERNLASSGITPTPSPVAVTPRRSRARRR